MTKETKTIALSVALSLAIVCGAWLWTRQMRAPQGLVGKWQMLAVTALFVEFAADGSGRFITQTSNYQSSTPFTYDVIDNSHVVITTTQASNAQPLERLTEYQIAGNQLTLINPNQSVQKYQRVN